MTHHNMVNTTNVLGFEGTVYPTEFMLLKRYSFRVVDPFWPSR